MNFLELNHFLSAFDAKSLRRLEKYFSEHAAEARRRAKLMEDRERAQRRFETELRLKPRLTATERKTADRRKRNIEIVRLATRGWSDADIGKRFGLHKNSISRIVRIEIEGQEFMMNGRRRARLKYGKQEPGTD